MRHVPSGQNIADCLSRLTKILAFSHRNSTTKEYVRMVGISATPRAITTREIERASAEVRNCPRSASVGRQETGLVLQAPTSYCVIKFLWLEGWS